MLNKLTAACIAILALANPIRCQTPQSHLAKALENNWTVRATAGDSILAEGRIRYYTADSAIIGSSHIAVPEITEIARRTRVGGGGTGGAIIGASGLALAGFFFASEFCKPDCTFRTVAVGVGLGATLGASVGGLLGAALNPPELHWIRVWP